MRKTRGVISGLKNYIMSQDSLSDSVNDAIRSEAEVLASRQLDAFHSSFSFCIDCRQYTCTNCWNDDAGRCQSCKPLERGGRWVQPDVADPLSANTWPVTDLVKPQPKLRIAGSEPVVEAPPEPVVEPQPMVAEEPVVVDQPMAAPAAPVEATPEVAAEPEPVIEIAATIETPPAVAPPEPTPIRKLRPIHETIVQTPRPSPRRKPAQIAADDEALAARRAQLDLLGLDDVGQGPVGAERRVLPYRSSGSASPVATLAGGAFWDASAREVAGATSQVGVRTCAECELSLSATARFCRRCGHPQSQSA
ncbi:MAG TPA: hypothetical protein VGQ66_03210 [Candidatus Limnocylindria bacterium]|nr:hypothetical protein [Candidatus Limnocylindria bacterium]